MAVSSDTTWSNFLFALAMRRRKKTVVGRVDVRVTVGVELLYAIRSTVNQCQQRGSQVERLVHGHSRSISRSSKVDNDVTLDSAAEVQV